MARYPPAIAGRLVTARSVPCPSPPSGVGPVSLPCLCIGDGVGTIDSEIGDRKLLLLDVVASNAHCADGRGWMFLLWWNTLSGSYLAFTSASRQ
jgi:hypothetical protein